MQIEIPEDEKQRLTASYAEKGIPAMFIKVPIVKATRKNDPSWAEIDLNALPDDVVKEIYLQGLKTLLNRGMSKITGEKDDKSVAAVMEIAAKNVEDLYAGKVRMSAGVRTKITGAVKTEAMRIARQIIKDGLKAAGLKVGHYKASDISAAAAEFLDSEDGREVWEEAKQTVEKREAEKKTSVGKSAKDLAITLKADATLVKKAEEAAAKRKKPSKDEAKGHLAAAAQAGNQSRGQLHAKH